LIFSDEATWSRVGKAPEVLVTGERKSVKILGAVELRRNRFFYQRDEVFNAQTYLNFLTQQIQPRYQKQGVTLIQDNASYPKEATVWQWFAANRHWLEVYQLPSYSPEFNPTERIWQHTRKNGTHNRFFLNLDELSNTLTRVFDQIQKQPSLIQNYLRPFC
jgi:transposase